MRAGLERRLRELVPGFARTASVYDAENRFPFETFAALRGAGYLAATVPEEFGGGGCGLAELCRLQQILAGGCSATALAANMHLHMIGVAAGLWRKTGDARLESFFAAIVEAGLVVAACASEGGGVNSFTDARTRASAVPGGYVVSGRKIFCSLSPIFDWVVTSAVTDANGASRLLQLLLARDTPGLVIHETWDAMGMRGTGSHELSLNDVFVPDEAVIAVREPGCHDLHSQEALKWFALSVAATYTGIAATARDFTVGLLRKGTFRDGAERKRELGAVEVELLAARAAVDRSASACDRHAWEDRPDLLADAVATKYLATNAAIRVVDACLELAGGPGYLKRCPLERWYRDVRAGVIHPPNNREALLLVGEVACLTREAVPAQATDADRAQPDAVGSAGP